MAGILETDLEEGIKISYPPHGTGEIISVGHDVELYFSGQDLKIVVPKAMLLVKTDVQIVNDTHDVPMMLQTLLTLDQERWEIKKTDVKVLSERMKTNIPIDLARLLVALWNGHSDNVQVAVRKQKIEDQVVEMMAEHLMMHLLGMGQEVTLTQSREKIRNYKIMRDNNMFNDQAAIKVG